MPNKTYTRDINQIAALCALSLHEADDFTPSGCLRIIRALELSESPIACELLTLERRLMLDSFGVPAIKVRPVQTADIIAAIEAARAFGGFNHAAQ